MTQTLIPHQGSQPPPRLTTARPVLSLHGSEAGIPMTWHVTLLENGYLIERAEGDIHSPAVWMQARRDAAVVGEDQVLELVRAVMLT
jgi:hypothetical protein